MAIAAIACGAIYVVVSPPQPLIKRTESRPPSVLLPYEQQITRKSDAPAAPQESAPQDHAIAPAETTPAVAASAKTAPKPDAQAAAPAEEGAGAPADGSAQENAGNPDAARMPPGEDADANNDGR